MNEEIKEKKVIFFFSSRRRHTRSKRDWSSDVCSSDLMQRMADEIVDKHRQPRHTKRFIKEANNFIGRSEERRVGKECRSRWWPKHCKKKNKAMDVLISLYK